jgi:hypothetical protein
VLPLELWPWFAWRRRKFQRRYAERTPEQAEVLRRLRDLGAMTSTDLGGARVTPGWWEWSPLKTAVEQLLARGEVVCVERRGFRRVYRLAEQAIPTVALADDPDDATCHTALVQLAAARLGVATADDLAGYFSLPVAAIRKAAEAAGLTPVAVEGWSRAAWADPALVGGACGRVEHRPVLLSPFDSLIWHRPRTERLFGFRHRLEAYTPAAKREHGYFVMPLLAGSRLAGRVDPKREGNVLRVRRLTVETRAIPAVATALADAALWVGCDQVTIDDGAAPAVLRDAVRAALS